MGKEKSEKKRKIKIGRRHKTTIKGEEKGKRREEGEKEKQIERKRKA